MAWVQKITDHPIHTDDVGMQIQWLKLLDFAGYAILVKIYS